jgi:hypothetical protein
MHHKRKRPKSSRSGCLRCKPWKYQGSCAVHRRKFSDRRRSEVASEKVGAFRCDPAD